MSVWELWPQDPVHAGALASACHLPPLLGQVLVNRGLTTASQAARFLSPSLEALEDPFRLPGMRAAIRRIRRAVSTHERIFIFGDSDVDGLTASTIVSEWLNAQEARVVVRISNRRDDGYGFPARLVPTMARARIDLAILLDCGSNQVEEVRALHTAGVDVIVVDHHVPLRPANPLALVNPYQGDGHGRELCTAGLALKLVHAWWLTHESSRRCAQAASLLEQHLDVAAVGTLADYAPLVGENRMFMRAGLARLATTSRPGLRRLCEEVRVTHASPEQVLRLLVPRLNAAGRLGSARQVWRLLVASTEHTVEGLVEHIGSAHAHTKVLYREMLAHAHAQVNRLHFRDQHVMVVSGHGWHAGLVGPIAAQLTQRYHRPVIAVALENGVGTGSGRSSVSFNLVKALQACETMLVRFGGHPRACGLTISTEKLEAFREQMNSYAQRQGDQRGMLQTLAIDAEASLSELTPAVAASLDQLMPFGPGHARPMVCVRGVTVTSTAEGAWVTDGHHRVKLRGREEGYAPDERYDVIGTLHEWRGDTALSLVEARSSTEGERVGSPSLRSPRAEHGTRCEAGSSTRH